MAEINEALKAIQVARGGGLINQKIRTQIPGWRKHRDKAEGALTNWCEIAGLEKRCALAMLEFFDKAPEKFAFHRAVVERDGDTIRVYCDVEISKGRFESVIKEFSIAELQK